MFWDAVNYGFPSHLVLVNGSLTAQRYFDEILEPQLLSVLAGLRDAARLIFQQRHILLVSHSTFFSTKKGQIVVGCFTRHELY